MSTLFLPRQLPRKLLIRLRPQSLHFHRQLLNLLFQPDRRLFVLRLGESRTRDLFLKAQ
ncbi:uncharacterized protein PODANS_2_12690 [Podospora anserina S mat+]|uniref:Podospora anserina S mat+ genomic DNA chromosome 2, supercontig 2 n=1 Tax=Podospora anserina (strain S / ATCC MYA-4624 / DSM 980 / FGSC 10383) TaxID=515849 RepID=B2B7Y7_PODAN|nr:uncharacterized protein PODANS_2_12690 [Podospora anserina S mat+]CAP73916.1 unnamed protein product [Podospora anserina S mat+]